MHSKKQTQQRPPSEHIYFSIESDYNSTVAPVLNNDEEYSNSASAILNTNSIQRQTINTQEWRQTGTHKSSGQQPYMV